MLILMIARERPYMIKMLDDVSPSWVSQQGVRASPELHYDY